MKLDFFSPSCRTMVSEAKFGVCDGVGGRAFVTIDLPERDWHAVVENGARLPISFHAVDGCLELRRPDGSMAPRCDAVMRYEDNLVFVELKEVQARWISDGIEQLRASVEALGKHHDLRAYRKKRAFLANRKHPNFQYSHKVAMQRFLNETGVRLIIGNRIKI